MGIRWIVLALVLWASPSIAQVATWPPPAGAIAFLGVYNTSPPTLSNGNVGFVQVDSKGNLMVNVAVGGGGGAVTIANGADVALGSTTDSACATSTGTCSLIALIKFLNSIGIPVQPAFSGDIIINPSNNFTRLNNTTAYASGQLMALALSVL